MKLSAPKFTTWLIALIVGGLGILMHYSVLKIQGLAIYNWELLLAGFVIFLIGTTFKDI